MVEWPGLRLCMTWLTTRSLPCSTPCTTHITQTVGSTGRGHIQARRLLPGNLSWRQSAQISIRTRRQLTRKTLQPFGQLPLCSGNRRNICRYGIAFECFSSQRDEIKTILLFAGGDARTDVRLQEAATRSPSCLGQTRGGLQVIVVVVVAVPLCNKYNCCDCDCCGCKKYNIPGKRWRNTSSCWTRNTSSYSPNLAR